MREAGPVARAAPVFILVQSSSPPPFLSRRAAITGAGREYRRRHILPNRRGVPACLIGVRRISMSGNMTERFLVPYEKFTRALRKSFREQVLCSLVPLVGDGCGDVLDVAG